jgi:hypothetical protein
MRQGDATVSGDSAVSGAAELPAAPPHNPACFESIQDEADSSKSEIRNSQRLTLSLTV